VDIQRLSVEYGYFLAVRSYGDVGNGARDLEPSLAQRVPELHDAPIVTGHSYD
jgi:hypothetical protein